MDDRGAAVPGAGTATRQRPPRWLPLLLRSCRSDMQVDRQLRVEPAMSSIEVTDRKAAARSRGLSITAPATHRHKRRFVNRRRAREVIAFGERHDHFEKPSPSQRRLLLGRRSLAVCAPRSQPAYDKPSREHPTAAGGHATGRELAIEQRGEDLRGRAWLVRRRPHRGGCASHDAAALWLDRVDPGTRPARNGLELPKSADTFCLSG